MNKVISGDYKGKSLYYTLGKVTLSTGILSQITID